MTIESVVDPATLVSHVVDRVVAVAPSPDVGIAPLAPVEGVVSCPALDAVGAAGSVDRVGARQAVEVVAPLRARERVGACGAGGAGAVEDVLERPDLAVGEGDHLDAVARGDGLVELVGHGDDLARGEQRHLEVVVPGRARERHVAAPQAHEVQGVGLGLRGSGVVDRVVAVARGPDVGLVARVVGHDVVAGAADEGVVARAGP